MRNMCLGVRYLGILEAYVFYVSSVSACDTKIIVNHNNQTVCMRINLLLLLFIANRIFQPSKRRPEDSAHLSYARYFKMIISFL